jgi:hypothetical protein
MHADPYVLGGPLAIHQQGEAMTDQPEQVEGERAATIDAAYRQVLAHNKALRAHIEALTTKLRALVGWGDDAADDWWREQIDEILK